LMGWGWVEIGVEPVNEAPSVPTQELRISQSEVAVGALVGSPILVNDPDGTQTN
jgi:hypothetical protein